MIVVIVVIVVIEVNVVIVDAKINSDSPFELSCTAKNVFLHCLIQVNSKTIQVAHKLVKMHFENIIWC